jgi:hypothetical protein
MGVLAQKHPEKGQLHAKKCEKKYDKKQDYLVGIRRCCIIIAL